MTRSSARASRRAWWARSPMVSSPRSRAWPTAPASTASSSTRATRSAPASSCDDPGRHRQRPAMTLLFLDADEIARRLSSTAAIDALQDALVAGLDPEADPPRGSLPVGDGELLVMASATAGHAAVKLVTVGGEPRIQGVCVVFDAATLAPVALVDGIALTNVRTPAVSALAVR